MKIPKEVLQIINILNANGFEAFIVGGCVRDIILNKIPNDWDITTSALPQNIISLFDKTIPTGIKHGTVTVIINDKSFEVTTYRQNEIYTNHRKPDSVSFTNCLNEDLKRRDFTMNAICYNSKLGFIDLFNGIYDIKNKIIRCIGNPDNRFYEDSLRMLRAIRFASTLGFSIEKNTFRSILKNAALIKSISAYRINYEIQRMLLGKYSSRFILLYKTNLLQNLFPFTRTCEDILKTALQKMSLAPYNLELRFSILICFVIQKLQCNQYLNNIFDTLQFSKKSKKLVSTLYQYYNYTFTNYELDIKFLLNKMGKDIFLTWLKVYEYTNNSESYDKITSVYTKIIEYNQPIFVSDLKINGTDLINIGIRNVQIGDTLEYLLKHCFRYPDNNKKEILLELAKKYVSNFS